MLVPCFVAKFFVSSSFASTLLRRREVVALLCALDVTLCLFFVATCVGLGA